MLRRSGARFVGARAPGHQRAPRRGLVLRLGALAFVAAVVAVAMSDALAPGPPASTAGVVGDEGSPIGGGIEVDLATAEAEAGFDLLIPQSGLASATDLVQVWLESDVHEVGLVFDTDSGEVVMDLYPTTSTNPKGEYQEEIDLGVAKSSLTTVLDQPAIVTEPASDVPGTNPAWLRFALDGVDVNLYSYELSTEDLVNIAQTLKPTST